MGGQQSTRRITVVNDQASGVIKISDSVVKRLEEEMSGGAQQKSRPQQKEPEPEKRPAEEPVPVPPQPPPQQQEQQQQHHHQRPIIHYVEKESLSSLKVKADKEKELAEAEEYWRKRLAKQEQEHTAMAKLQESSMADTVDKLSSTFSTGRSPPVCQQERDFVLQCYMQNKDTPLKCSEVVKNFSRCVNSARLNTVGRSG